MGGFIETQFSICSSDGPGKNAEHSRGISFLTFSA